MVKIKLSANEYMLSFQRGEKLWTGLKEFAIEHKVRAGTLQGIGGLTNIVLGTTTLDGYIKKTFTDDAYEVTSIIGNFSMEDGDKELPHCHITFADRNWNFVGGHLFEAEVAIVAEIYVKIWDEKSGVKMNRYKDPAIPHLKALSEK